MSVIQFPRRQQQRIPDAPPVVRLKPPGVCDDCDHSYLGSRGIYCAEFAEFIWDPACAAECEAYEPQ